MIFSSTVTILLVALLCRAGMNCQVAANCMNEDGSAFETCSLRDDGTTVLLGGLFPFHGTTDTQICGNLQDFAVQQSEAMVFAINSINNDASLLPNVTLAFSIRDTCSNPNFALEQTFEYVQNKNITCNNNNRVAVSGVSGAHFSRVSMDVANLLRLYSIPQISYISTADILSDKTRFDYFFRTVPPDSLQARAIADIIKRFNWTYVFLLNSDDSYGNGGIMALVKELELSTNRVCIAARIPLSVKALDRDYDEAVRKMSEKWVNNASVAVLFGHMEAAEGMMKALMRYQQNDSNVDRSELDNLTWIGTDSWGDSLPSKYHSMARGMLSVIPRAEESLSFDKYFTSLHPNQTNNKWFHEFWESRFNCSLSGMTCDLENESITLNTTDHKQISQATLIADTVMAFAHAIHSLIESECNGTLCDEILVSRLTGKAIKGELIRNHLYNVSFRGSSSNNVSFNAEGDEPGAYVVKNLQRVTGSQFAFRNIGTWDHISSLTLTSDVEWVTGDTKPPKSFCSPPCNGGQQPNFIIAEQQCCWTCSPCSSEKGYSNGSSLCGECNETHMPNSDKTGCVSIPITYLKWSDMWAIPLLVITSCGLVATLCIIIVFIIFHKHKVVKASSRELVAILFAGLILCYIMPFPFIARPSVAICTIRRFGIGFSFSVCFSALLVKTNRIHRIFNNAATKSTKLPRFTSTLSQVIFTFILVSVQIIMAVIWLVLERPAVIIQYGPRSAELSCKASPIIGIAVLLSYNFLLLLLSTYFAFRARKVPENFNEAKYINITLYTLCILWLAFMSTYFATTQLGIRFQTISLTLAIILSATTTLVFLFIPKIFLLVSQTKKAKKASEQHPTSTGVNLSTMTK